MTGCIYPKMSEWLENNCDNLNIRLIDQSLNPKYYIHVPTVIKKHTKSFICRHLPSRWPFSAPLWAMGYRSSRTILPVSTERSFCSYLQNRRKMEPRPIWSDHRFRSIPPIPLQHWGHYSRAIPTRTTPARGGVPKSRLWDFVWGMRSVRPQRCCSWGTHFWRWCVTWAPR
jgi:hypothetical protein